MDNQYTPEQSNTDNNIDSLIQELHDELSEKDVPQNVPKELRESEYSDAFDEYFDQSFDEPSKPPVQKSEAKSKAAPSSRKQLNFFQRRRERRRRKRKDSIVLSIFGNIIYFSLVAAAAIMIAKFAWLCADDVLALTKKDSLATVTISEGDNLNKITEKLHDAGLIEYPWLFNLYGKYSHVEKKVSPGVYELNTLFDYHALVNGMSGSYNRMTTTITIIEGKTSMQIFEALEEAGICTVDELSEAAAHHNFDYDFLDGLEHGSAYRLDGYLFPDTYEFYLSDDADNVIDKFLSNFNNRMDETLMARVATTNYSLREILTIASIIQEEAAAPDEEAKIASVIYNRLNSESLSRLQMDSTVFYAAEITGSSFDTELDNPYNTYMYAGLPAGPIDNPGLNAIEAALYPEDTKYYFFAYGKDGVSHFYQDWDSFEAFIASEDYIGSEV